MWNKSIDINWRKRRVSRSRNPDDASTKGEEDAEDAEDPMKGTNGKIKRFLKIIAIPIFGGIGLAILILGEINFYSRQVQYETEPLASVGKALCNLIYLCYASPANAIAYTQVNGLPSVEHP